MTNQAAIDLYNTLRYVSLAVAVVGFLLSAFLFYYLEILDVFLVHMGKGTRKKTASKAETQKREPKQKRRSKEQTLDDDYAIQTQSQTKETTILQNSQWTNVQAAAQTTILGAAETSVLGTYREITEAPPTAQLAPSRTQMANAESPKDGSFRLTEETIFIHTDEII